MAVLLLRLAGPLQSWGTRSRFRDRDTERFPSKSGVVGLLCAAVGRPRGEPLDDLAALAMAARADRPGRWETDFQVAQGVLRASGSVSKDPLPSHRHYLADAVFLVGLEGERGLLEALDAALARPVWTLYLGRKGYVPSCPVRLPEAVVDAPLDEAMVTRPALVEPPRTRRDEPPRVEIEWECGPTQDGVSRHDVPLSFANGQRAFLTRRVWHTTVPWPVKEGGDVAQPPVA